MARTHIKDGPNGGASSAALIRRAAIWASPIVIATSIVATYTVNDHRDVREIRDRLDRITNDIADRVHFLDRDGIRDPIVRMAVDRHVEQLLKQYGVLTRAWALRLKDLNPNVNLPKEE